jgi:hypothetical protein
MNPEKQKQAIAEICGVEPELVEWWAHKPDPSDPDSGSICMSARSRQEVQDWIDAHPAYAEGFSPKAYYRYPNYTGDLNMMRRAEKMLTTEEQWREYVSVLWDLCGLTGYGAEHQPLIHADAWQKAQAFLRVFGRWVVPEIQTRHS